MQKRLSNTSGLCTGKADFGRYLKLSVQLCVTATQLSQNLTETTAATQLHTLDLKLLDLKLLDAVRYSKSETAMSVTLTSEDTENLPAATSTSHCLSNGMYWSMERRVSALKLPRCATASRFHCSVDSRACWISYFSRRTENWKSIVWNSRN